MISTKQLVYFSVAGGLALFTAIVLVGIFGDGRQATKLAGHTKTTETVTATTSDASVFIEPELGTLAGPVTVGSDANASGGQFIQFGSTNPNPAPTYPAEVLNLTNWKITLPTGSSGSPTEITQPTLATYSIDPWFVVVPQQNAVRFRAPVNGVTTSGSSYPRSELREMKDSGINKAAWSSTVGTHTMFIDQSITAVPQNKKHVVAGQIHDAGDDVIVIRLEYPKLFIDINGTDGPTLDPNYTLGKRFTVKFEVMGGQTKIFYNGSPTPAYTLSKNYTGAYFKSGAYTQSNCGTEGSSSLCNQDNYGEVIVYGLNVTHDSNDTTAPSAPNNLTATTVSGTQVNLTWGASTDNIGVTDYKIFRNNAEVPSPINTTTSFSDTTVSPNSTYTYYVLAFDAAGNASPQSSPVSVTTPCNTLSSDRGVATMNMTIPTAGTYRVWSRIQGGGDAANSYWLQVDGTCVAAVGDLTGMPANAWTWVNYKDGTATNILSLSLAAGTHTVTLFGREGNVKVDRILFTTNSSCIPSGNGENCLMDTDGDGFENSLETYLGTDPNRACPATTAPNDEAVDAWPADFDDNGYLDITDINSFLYPKRADGSFNKFGHPVPDPADPTIQRWDLQPGSDINIGDLNAINPGTIASTARPPMFGGEPAFFAGKCPTTP